jgi:hypothetical protein
LKLPLEKNGIAGVREQSVPLLRSRLFVFREEGGDFQEFFETREIGRRRPRVLDGIPPDPKRAGQEDGRQGH